MEYAGAVSGAALGYIHGNTRGAIKGWVLGKNLAKNYSTGMAPIPPKRPITPNTPGRSRRRRYSTGSDMFDVQYPGPSSSRRGSTSTTSSRISSLISGGYGARTVRPSKLVNSTLVSNPTAVRRKRTKGVRYKKRKRVTVSRNFKKKVRKALTDKARGFYKKIHYARIPSPSDDIQYTEDLGLFFEPVRFAEALQVLFADKVPVEIPVWSDITFDEIMKTKLYVIDSWAQFTFKNMGQRTHSMIIRENKPRARTLTTQTAYQDWRRGLQELNTNGMNPQNNTPETLTANPKLVPQFNEFWKCEETQVTLGPGETFTWKLQGPSDFQLDYIKMTRRIVDAGGQSLTTMKPFARNVTVTTMLDIVQDSSGKTGRYASNVPTFTGGIAVQYDEYFKLECPETVGLGTATTTGDNNLSYRKNVNVIKVFSSAQIGDINDVVEENPLAEIVNPTN